MEKIDARTHNQQTQYELRKLVVRLRKGGFSNKETTETVGISVAHASTIWNKYVQGGIEAIKPGKRGRRQGARRVPDAEREKAVQKMPVDKGPDQLRVPFALWSRGAVRLAIKRESGLEVRLQTLTGHLKRWGFTPQKPVKQAYEQGPKELSPCKPCRLISIFTHRSCNWGKATRPLFLMIGFSG